MTTQFWIPPVTKASDGQNRRVGFEIEFGNVSVSETAHALAETLGGELQESNPFIFQLQTEDLGTLRIERDTELLNTVRYREFLGQLNIDFDEGTVAREIEQGVDRLSSSLVPCEIVTAPLEFSQFRRLHDIVQCLNQLGATGTQDSLINAYGTHLNPSIPELSAATIRNYMQVFLLLSDWIIKDSNTDFSRRYFTRFIDPFPKAFLEHVLDMEYQPGEDKLIADYLRHNPTRNRALDLLPMLSEIDSATVQANVKSSERSLIKKRPAFHYRLPDCRLGDADWSIANEWNRWWYVEAIASHDTLREELIRQWQSQQQKFLLPFSGDWIHRVTRFINKHIAPPES